MASAFTGSMRTPWALLLCFHFLVLAFCEGNETADVKKVLASTYQDQTVFIIPGSECGWNCTYKVSESNSEDALVLFVLHSRFPIHQVPMDNGTLFRVNVRYEMKVADKCTNETIQTVNVTKDWQIRLIRPPNKHIPRFIVNALEQFSTLIEKESLYSVETSCTLEVGAISFPRNQTSVNKDLSSDDLQKIIIRTAQIGSLHDICTEKAKKNRQICIEISEVKQEWTQTLLFVSVALFVPIFSYIGPFIVCLYAPTEVMHQGIRQIVVDGPSPVGFRSLIGNYFFSMDDTMWHRARRFIMRVLILPIPFLIPALFVEYLIRNNVLPHQTSLRVGHLSQPLYLLSYSCYFIQAFYYSFFVMKPNNWLSSAEGLFHGNLPWRMLAYTGCVLSLGAFIITPGFFPICLFGWVLLPAIKRALCSRPPCKARTDFFQFIILSWSLFIGSAFARNNDNVSDCCCTLVSVFIS